LNDIQVIQIIIQTTEGLKYLHSKDIIHRDLACRNLLVLTEESWTIKIADFGLSRILSESNYYKITTSEIPIRWAAPEVFSSFLFNI